MISNQFKKLRILFVIPTLGGGGAEILLGNIVEELFRKGHEVMIVTLHPMHFTYENFPNKSFIEENIKILQCNSRVKFSFFKKPTIINQHYKKIIEEFKPNIIHSHLFEAELIARTYYKKDIAYFSHGHDNMSQLLSFRNFEKYNKQLIANLIERKWLLQKYKQTNNNFIAISKDVIEFLKKNLPKHLHGNIELLHNAIDTKRFSKSSKSIIDNSDKIRIVSVGNLVPKKNHKLLIDVALQLREMSLDFSIDILGYGPLIEDLKKYTETNNLEKNITFHGNVSNVEDFLKTAHFYLHTAKYEPFGLVIIEAMASGLPVITLDGKGNRDIIKDGENGFMIYKENPFLFTEKILFLWKNRNEYYKISQNASNFSKQFDIENYTDKLIQIYIKAIEGRIIS
jgi:glycosyltransferase involved in cell wall biosynthesis